MSRKTQITLTDRQYALLHDEASRTGLSVAELVRRCIDLGLRPHRRARVRGWEATVALFKRPDAAALARRRPAHGGGLIEDA